MPWNQVPRAAEIVGAAIDSLVINRPSAVPFANNGVGRYADLITGWNAQANLAIQRLASEVIAKRIGLATSDALTDLCRSEFDTDRDVSPQTTSLGTVTISRLTTAGGAGVIPSGARIKRTANQTSNPPVPGAFYAVSQDTYISSAATSVTIPIVGSAIGSATNAPDIYGYPTLTFVDVPFDPSFVVQYYEVSGGADDKTDEDLRIEALAYAIGKYGPTIGSVLAGAYRGTGVRHAAVIDVTQISGTYTPAAYTGVLIADASWGGINNSVPGQSVPGAWANSVQQQLQDPVTGFCGVGASTIVTCPSNQAITVTCTVMLADQNYAAFTNDIVASIQTALQTYFDDRPDWYTFKTSAVQSVIAGADSRIRTCTFATVNNFATGAVISDPTIAPVATTAGLVANHFFLVQQGVVATFIPPA